MNPEFVISIIAIVLSIGSLVWTIAAQRQQSHDSSIASCFPLMAQAEAMLKETPTALKFHGITTDEIVQAGLTSDEFVYLVMNFSAAGVFYRMLSPNDRSALNPGSYRYAMLESPETRKAWPLLRRLINPEIGNYSKKIEATIRLIEEQKNKSS